jgi:signal transduction histidine kinase
MLGAEESLFEQLAAAVKEGREAAALAAHVCELTGCACVVFTPRRGAWAVAAAGRVALGNGRLRLRDEEIEGWLAAVSGRRPWCGVPVRHGDACVARVMLHSEEVSGDVRAASAVAAPFLAARRQRIGASEMMHSTVAQIVHDFGQPIAALSLAHEALVHVGRLDTVLLDRARRSVVRLRELTDDLLLLAYPHKRRVESVELGPLLADLIADHSDRARPKGVRLSLDVRQQVSLRGGRVSLLRAIGNVLSNALIFAPEDSVVEVALECQDAVTIEVRDQGPGVPPSLREHVFDPFFTTRAGGNGLGLAVARRVAHQHGGSVRFLEGPGGVVRFEFPRSRVVGEKPLLALPAAARPAVL